MMTFGWIAVVCLWISITCSEEEFDPSTSCPGDWVPKHTLEGHCYCSEDTTIDEPADYSGAEHACEELHPNAHVMSIDEQNEEDFFIKINYFKGDNLAVEPVKIWLKGEDEDSCVSATIDPRHNKPQYNSNENCSQQLHFICEAKQTDLYKEKEEEENEFLPQALKRHKYGHRDSAMEMSNLALSQQERSHRADEDDSIAHEQEQISRDIDDEVHARHKRALGEDYNGDDGQVLVDDTVAFQANIDLHLDSIPNNTAAYRREYIESGLATAEGLYDRLKESNLTDIQAAGNVMIAINTAVTSSKTVYNSFAKKEDEWSIVNNSSYIQGHLGTLALRGHALRDDMEKFSGPQGLTMWVKRQTQNTHQMFTVKDKETDILIPQDVVVTDSADMYGLVVVMAHDKTQQSLPGINSTSTFAARIVFAHFVTINNTVLTAKASVNIKFKHLRSAESDEIDVCSNLYAPGGQYVHWSLKLCTEAKYQFSGTITECECSELGTYANFQVYDPLAAGLKLLSLLGCAVSLIACLVTSLVVIGYQLMKTSVSFVRLMFLVALGSAECVAIFGDRYTDIRGVCGIVALWLHFSTLASFCWLLSYTLLLGNEMRTAKNYYLDLKLYNLIGWMVPACIVCITAIWRYTDYRDPILCWVSSDGLVYLSFVIPAAIIIFIILIFLLYDLKLLVVKKEDMKKVLGRPVAWSGIRSVFFLLPLLSCTWMFAEYSVITRNLLTQLLFAVSNTLLGICIFIFMCHFNAEIRQAKRLREITPHSNYTITKYDVPPVDPSYEPSEKYPFPVLTRADSVKPAGGRNLLPGAVDDWEVLAGVITQAQAASRMTMHRDGANEDSRPNSAGNETSSTLLPADSRGGSESSQDPHAESAGSRKRPPSGNKIRVKTCSHQATPSQSP